MGRGEETRRGERESIEWTPDYFVYWDDISIIVWVQFETWVVLPRRIVSCCGLE